jgi:threonine aldolase
MLIDLRSDTVTKPTDAMRRAMAEAEVGDAEYDDDPTVNLLQERAAEATGKEAAIYLVTGTMCNQIAVHVLSRAGHSVVCAADSHIGGIEGPAASILNGVTFREVSVRNGIMEPSEVRAALAPDEDRGDIVDFIAVENTFSAGGGIPWTLPEVEAVAGVAEAAGKPLYMDASRIFNASAATGTPVADYAARTEALMFCLSKGLGAPIGSVLCGSAAFVEEARKTKILFGISWRQAGITAAAGLVALKESPGRLHEDHDNARRLAEGISDTTPEAVDLGAARTNMVFVRPAAVGMDSNQLADALANEGVLANQVGGRIRFVTHQDVSAADIDGAIEAWRKIAGG